VLAGVRNNEMMVESINEETFERNRALSDYKYACLSEIVFELNGHFTNDYRLCS
jgi:hypothetical protein